jgi:predicted ABC-type ATPase
LSGTATITVLAGVNGAGKSSIGGGFTEGVQGAYFNPDSVALQICALHPDISHTLANGHAWQIGRALLEQAIAQGRDYRFETTLGGRTIADLLERAARSGHRVNIWFCGLASPELHLSRVARRVAHGGHNIPAGKIRERWNTSRENLIRLLPMLHQVRVYDNSIEADPAEGHAPQPVLWLDLKDRQIIGPPDLSGAPDWAQPILAAAMVLHRTAARAGGQP